MSVVKTWRFWAGCLVSLLCLWLAFRSVPLGEVVHIAASANISLLLAAVILQVLAIVARSWRWLILLDKAAGLADSFWAQSIGFLFTNVFPLRLGELARVFVLSERWGLPMMQVAASAIVERLLDVTTTVSVLLLVLPWMQVPSAMRQVGIFFGILALVGLGLLLIAVRFSDSTKRFLESLQVGRSFLSSEKIGMRWGELVSGFLPLTHWPIALRAGVWSLLPWALSIAMFWNVLLAFQSDASLVEAAFMMATLAFAVAVPSSPGFVGVFQLVGQQALVLPFGAKYEPAAALAITVTIHLVYYVITTALGIAGLWRLGASFLSLGHVITDRQPDRKIPARVDTRRL